MYTLRMYWEDSYATEFSGTVMDVWQEAGRLFVVLDRTLFYPEGGGQPSDQGIIVPIASMLSLEAKDAEQLYSVIGVSENNGKVIHVLDSQAKSWLSLGQTVYGKIDYEHRFDLMQQHTGQHILSRAFEEICGAKTVGFHLGTEYVSVDLEVHSIADDVLMRVEDLANEIVFRNLPVRVVEYEQSQVPSDIRRRIPTDSPKIRVVYVDDFDACACGGTHVRATGEVGIIKINEIDRAHSGVRVVFRCGKRALRDLREKEQILFDTAHIFSVGYRDLYDAALLQIERSSELTKAVQALKKELLAYEIESLVEEADAKADTNLLDEDHSVFVKRVEGKDIGDLKSMCREVAEATNSIAVLFSCAPRFFLVVASPFGESDSRGCIRASTIVENLGKKWGIKGGGTPQVAQMGSKEQVDKSEDEVREVLLEVFDELSKDVHT